MTMDNIEFVSHLHILRQWGMSQMPQCSHMGCDKLAPHYHWSQCHSKGQSQCWTSSPQLGYLRIAILQTHGGQTHPGEGKQNKWSQMSCTRNTKNREIDQPKLLIMQSSYSQFSPNRQQNNNQSSILLCYTYNGFPCYPSGIQHVDVILVVKDSCLICDPCSPVSTGLSACSTKGVGSHECCYLKYRKFHNTNCLSALLRLYPDLFNA